MKDEEATKKDGPWNVNWYAVRYIEYDDIEYIFIFSPELGPGDSYSNQPISIARDEFIIKSNKPESYQLFKSFFEKYNGYISSQKLHRRQFDLVD